MCVCRLSYVKTSNGSFSDWKSTQANDKIGDSKPGIGKKLPRIITTNITLSPSTPVRCNHNVYLYIGLTQRKPAYRIVSVSLYSLVRFLSLFFCYPRTYISHVLLSSHTHTLTWWLLCSLSPTQKYRHNFFQFVRPEFSVFFCAHVGIFGSSFGCILWTRTQQASVNAQSIM